MTLHFFRCTVGVMQKTSDVIGQDAQHQVLFQLLDEVEHESSAHEVLLKLKYSAESHFSQEEHYLDLLKSKKD